MPLRYPPDFMAQVAACSARSGTQKAAEQFGVSRSAAHRWQLAAGHKRRRIGAPKGNLNALGGRILNTSRPQ
jgi:transposase-like protein